MILYSLGFLLGYFVGTNLFVEKQIKLFAGLEYANPLIRNLSKHGGLGGWFCTLPAAYFVSTAHGNGVQEGFIFVLAYLGGIFFSAPLQIPILNHVFSALTLFINISLTFLVYFLSN